MILVDTGFLIALTNHRDEMHARAVAWGQAVQGREALVVTEYVLTECLNRLSRPEVRGVGIVLAEEIFGENSGFRYVPGSRRLFDAGFDLFVRRRDKAWSLTDCISFALMTDRGMTQALAHDRHFEQPGFDPLLRRDLPA